MKPAFELDENPSVADLARLGVGLTEHAAEALPVPGFQKFALFKRDAERQIVAGISGMINWNWAFVQNFWIAQDLRRQGLGKQMLDEFEAYAKRRGCEQIHLDTFSFQAPAFYEQQGYTLFATLDDYPYGHQRHFYKKKL